MFVPFLLLLISVGLGAWMFVTSGQTVSDGVLVAALSAVGSLILLLRSLFRRRPKWIVLDGSNIMNWLGDGPSLDTVTTVVHWLEDRNYAPVVWFDANVGYKVSDRYLGPGPLAGKIGVPESRVRVAPKGTPADPLLLQEAMTRKARVVSNDKFRDWIETFPKLKEDGFLVATRRDEGKLTLKL